MVQYRQYLDWIDGQKEQMARLVFDWAAINSHAYNLAGVDRMRASLIESFRVLGGKIAELPLDPEKSVNSLGEIVERPLGRALSVIKRPDAKVQALLAVHLDTVFEADHPFQRPERAGNRIRGPGVCDAKGGLVIMLKALEAFERTPFAQNVGWEVFINTDEEIGSPSSGAVLQEIARARRFGLLFEPALPDGALVGERSGAGAFTLVIRGPRAAGNDRRGRNALHLAAYFIVHLTALNRKAGIAVNFDRLEGDLHGNATAELAVARFRIKATTPDKMRRAEKILAELVRDVNRPDDFTASLHGSFHAPPKTLSSDARALMKSIQECAREEKLSLVFRRADETCDGNKLAAAGLPNVDTLGARGGGAHTDREYLELDSLAERARLTARFLMKASGC